MVVPLADDVWARLDRNAGRMSRRGFRWFIGIPLVAGLLTLLGVFGWRSGVLWPNLGRDLGGSSWGTNIAEHSFVLTFPVRNDGLVDVDVESFGRSGPGLRLAGTIITRNPIPAGGSADLQLSYVVTDCDGVPAGHWPVPVRVSHGRTAYVEAPEMVSPDAPDDYSWSGVDPYAMDWQVKLAGMACGRMRE